MNISSTPYHAVFNQQQRTNTQQAPLYHGLNTAHQPTQTFGIKKLMLPFLIFFALMGGLKAQTIDMEEGKTPTLVAKGRTTTLELGEGTNLAHIDYTDFDSSEVTHDTFHIAGDGQDDVAFVYNKPNHVTVTSEGVTVIQRAYEADKEVARPVNSPIPGLIFEGAIDAYDNTDDTSMLIVIPKHRGTATTAITLTGSPTAGQTTVLLPPTDGRDVTVKIEPDAQINPETFTGGIHNTIIVTNVPDRNSGRLIISTSSPKNGFTSEVTKKIPEDSGPYGGVIVTLRTQTVVGPNGNGSENFYSFALLPGMGVDKDDMAEIIEDFGYYPEYEPEPDIKPDLLVPKGFVAKGSNSGKLSVIDAGSNSTMKHVSAEPYTNYEFGGSDNSSKPTITRLPSYGTNNITLTPNAQAGIVINDFIFTSHATLPGTNTLLLNQPSGFTSEETKIMQAGPYQGVPITKYTQASPNNGELNIFVVGGLESDMLPYNEKALTYIKDNWSFMPLVKSSNKPLPNFTPPAGMSFTMGDAAEYNVNGNVRTLRPLPGSLINLGELEGGTTADQPITYIINGPTEGEATVLVNGQPPAGSFINVAVVDNDDSNIRIQFVNQLADNWAVESHRFHGSSTPEDVGQGINQYTFTWTNNKEQNQLSGKAQFLTIPSTLSLSEQEIVRQFK